jgi:hypothetical protein
MVKSLHPTNPVPQLLKPLRIIENLKGFTVSPIRASTIPNKSGFTDIDTNYKRFAIDSSKFFCFNFIHGYTPFPGVSPACELAESARKSIAFFIGLN